MASGLNALLGLKLRSTCAQHAGILIPALKHKRPWVGAMGAAE